MFLNQAIFSDLVFTDLLLLLLLDEPYDVDKIGSALVGLSTLSNP